MKPVYFLLTLLPFVLANERTKTKKVGLHSPFPTLHTYIIPSSCSNISLLQPRPHKTTSDTPTPTHVACGTRLGSQCPDGQICVDDPNSCSMAVDCAGICITPVFCGGFGNIACPKGQQWIDDPRDDCDPFAGGADCGGVCA